MTSEPIFINIWRRYEDFEFTEPTVPFCQYGDAFAHWAESGLFLTNNADLIQLNQSKVLLLDRYFDFFSVVPKDHRYYFNPKNHICIFQVFVEYYRRIKTRELTLTPPTPPPQIMGIVFGEEE